VPDPLYVGGQAVMEGVMMRGARTWAVAVRRPSGDIEVQLNDAPTWAKRVAKIPLVRGVAALAESMSLGLRALNWSAARAADEDDEQPLTRGQTAVLTLVAVGLFVGLFVVLPAVATKSIGDFGSSVAFNAVEGVIKLALFLGYIVLIGRMDDVRRLFEYHGAEHKAIAAFERGVPLTAASAQRFTTEHVRCGTNFLLIVMVLSIATHTLVGRPGWLVLVASRVLLVPVVAGIAYEYIRFVASRIDRNQAMRVLMAPGLALQRLTTREPSLDQLEVAIASLRAVLTTEQLTEVDARPAATAA
jgi:uncharacterized protein YqhQ